MFKQNLAYPKKTKIFLPIIMLSYFSTLLNTLLFSSEIATTNFY
jgi:hypothetical protein